MYENKALFKYAALQQLLEVFSSALFFCVLFKSSVREHAASVD
jgi:hypothetical protein